MNLLGTSELCLSYGLPFKNLYLETGSSFIQGVFIETLLGGIVLNVLYNKRLRVITIAMSQSIRKSKK